MIKCPNCGSTAQIKFIEGYHYTPTRIAEKYECGCSATIICHYELKSVVNYTDDKAKFLSPKEVGNDALADWKYKMCEDVNVTVHQGD